MISVIERWLELRVFRVYVFVTCDAHVVQLDATASIGLAAAVPSMMDDVLPCGSSR